VQDVTSERRHKMRILYFFMVVCLVFTLGCAGMQPERDADCVSPSCKYIFIESTPPAEIYIDGVFVGMTPDRNVKVKTSTQIELKAKGYQTSSITISRVTPDSLSINRAITQKRITIRGDGINVILKEQ
jgi:hypothetical protein